MGKTVYGAALETGGTFNPPQLFVGTTPVQCMKAGMATNCPS